MRHLMTTILMMFSVHAQAGPIHDYATEGDIKGIKEALEIDPNAVNLRDSNGLAAIHHAVTPCHPKVVKLLLKAGSPVDPRDRINATPLLRASYEGRMACIELLIDAGADPNQRTDRRLTPLHVAAMRGHWDVAELLLKNGANVNAREISGATPLDLAERSDVVKILKIYGGKPGRTSQ